MKTFFFFFFGEHLRFVSLVLGLEHSCPWPRECLSSKRLSLASDFFCVLGLGLGLEPCVLDSTSVKNAAGKPGYRFSQKCKHCGRDNHLSVNLPFQECGVLCMWHPRPYSQCLPKARSTEKQPQAYAAY